MTISKLSCAKLAPLFLCLVAVYAQAGSQRETHSFTRLVRPNKTTVVLETRAVKLVPEGGNGPVVWLVGAAHIGQSSYYKAIQKILDAQSLVLFEGVRPAKSPETVKASQNSSSKPVEAFPTKDKSSYRLFADAVGLDFQLYDIDYSKKNFVNSDLSWAEVSSLSSKQGAATATKISGIGRLLDAGSSEGQLLGTFLQQIKSDPGSQEAMRIVLAEALSTPGVLVSLLGEGTTDVLINRRNEKVLSDLDKRKSVSSVAIFFGAAHMPDMEHRLISDKHYHEAQEIWIPAITGDETKVTGNGTLILAELRTLLGPKKS
jgi:hypothetical protein